MKQGRRIIYLAGFLFSLPIALTSYINSSFVSSFVGEKLVGIIFVLGSICSILALLISPRIFRKIGGYKFLLLIAFLEALVFISLFFFQSTFSVIPIFVFGFALNTLLFFSLDELLKIFSRDAFTGRIRGFYLIACNLAWIVAQISFATFLGGFSFRTIYLASFIITGLFFIISLFSLKNIPDPEYDDLNTFRYMEVFLRNKNLARAYGINFLLQFFYCWMIIYTPLYLYLHLGFNWKELGFIFTIMLIPFITVPFYTGKLADKIGERKILMSGFIIAATATIALFFVREHNVFIWAALLFATRLGASSLDSTSDTYFLKHIKPENEELLGVYRSASPVSYILGPIIASLVLLVVPSFNYLFLILGAIMLYGAYLSSTIRKSDV